MDKSLIKEIIIAELKDQKAALEKAVASAREATTHADAKQEGKYDTRAIEAGYIAGAQMERLRILDGRLKAFENLDLAAMRLYKVRDGKKEKRFLVNPLLGGLTLFENDENRRINLLERLHPIAKELAEAEVGDEVEVELPNRVVNLTILARE